MYAKVNEEFIVLLQSFINIIAKESCVVLTFDKNSCSLCANIVINSGLKRQRFNFKISLRDAVFPLIY